MNKLIYDKKIVFDDFQLYRESDNSCESEYGYPENKTTIEEWEEVNVYICPHCIKKYGLYNETETTREQIDKVIADQKNGGYKYYDLTCGVDGCYNKDSFDGWLSIKKSELIKYNNIDLEDLQMEQKEQM